MVKFRFLLPTFDLRICEPFLLFRKIKKLLCILQNPNSNTAGCMNLDIPGSITFQSSSDFFICD